MVIYSLASIVERLNNLDIIIPNILKQSDLIFVNLIGHTRIPNVLKDKKIILNSFKKAGSEIRFFDYNRLQNDSYYFTIDDDIFYPENYTEIMTSKMKKYDNNVVCCVHGSNIDKNLKSNFYKKNRKVFHFTKSLKQDEEVMIPGVGTSCFYKEKHKISIDDYEVNNMSDVYTGCFLAKQGIKRVSIERTDNWLKPLNEFDVKIYGNNPYDEIDKVINKYKEKL